ncbi:MAG: hypothetical protein AAF596_10250, partial [Planctomycetota bacterium]
GRGPQLAAAGVLALLAFGAWQAMLSGNQRVAADPRYRVTAESIAVSPPPSWVRGDVRSEALSQFGPEATLSSLDPPERLEQPLATAFARHAWVHSVVRITKSPPNKLRVELEYRTPLAAIGDAGRPGELLLADAEAVRLPEADLTAAELRHLPRITLPASAAAAGAPPLGQPWVDTRVRGAVAIAGALGPAWWDLQLADIRPVDPPRRGAGASGPVYELLSQGGTRIVWGAAPMTVPSGEPSFPEKLARLTAYVNANGPLRGDRSPASIDLRSSRLLVEPRTALNAGSDEPITK